MPTFEDLRAAFLDALAVAEAEVRERDQQIVILTAQLDETRRLLDRVMASPRPIEGEKRTTVSLSLPLPPAPTEYSVFSAPLPPPPPPVAPVSPQPDEDFGEFICRECKNLYKRRGPKETLCKACRSAIMRRSAERARTFRHSQPDPTPEPTVHAAVSSAV